MYINYMKKEKSLQNNSKKVVATNKKAYFDFLLFDKFEAGISLLGTEIKSIRKGAINLKDSYVKITDNLEAYLINCHISPYEFRNIYNHDPKRDRKYTVVPTQAYFSSRYLKIEIALAKGKKLYDKRESLKAKDLKREIERNK